MKKYVATAALLLALGGLAPVAAHAEANDNANCLGENRSVQKGKLDVETGRAFAQLLGQNENSEGIGAWMSFAAQQPCD